MRWSCLLNVQSLRNAARSPAARTHWRWPRLPAMPGLKRVGAKNPIRADQLMRQVDTRERGRQAYLSAVVGPDPDR